MEGIKIKSVTGIPTVKFWTLEEKNYKLASDLKMVKTLNTFSKYINVTVITLNKSL